MARARTLPVTRTYATGVCDSTGQPSGLLAHWRVSQRRAEGHCPLTLCGERSVAIGVRGSYTPVCVYFRHVLVFGYSYTCIGHVTCLLRVRLVRLHGGVPRSLSGSGSNGPRHEQRDRIRFRRARSWASRTTKGGRARRSTTVSDQERGRAIRAAVDDASGRMPNRRVPRRDPSSPWRGRSGLPRCQKQNGRGLQAAHVPRAVPAVRRHGGGEWRDCLDDCRGAPNRRVPRRDPSSPWRYCRDWKNGGPRVGAVAGLKWRAGIHRGCHATPR